MEKVTKTIEQFLSENENNVITVSCGNLRLRKENATAMRFAFSANDIANEYGSVSDLLRSLPDKGFAENVLILLRKAYGSGTKTTYHNVKSMKINIQKRNEEPQQETYETMHTATHTPQPTPPQAPQMQQMQQSAMPMGLGYTPVATSEWIDSKVLKTRFEDLQSNYKKLESDYLDAKSENRKLKEENASLKLKNETAEERKNLAIEKDRMERKSFWESDGVQGLLPGLGAFLEKAAGGQVGGALGMPAQNQELSPQKQQLMAYIQTPTCTEEQAQLLAMVINGYSEELVKLIINYLNNKQNG